MWWDKQDWWLHWEGAWERSRRPVLHMVCWAHSWGLRSGCGQLLGSNGVSEVCYLVALGVDGRWWLSGYPVAWWSVCPVKRNQCFKNGPNSPCCFFTFTLESRCLNSFSGCCDLSPSSLLWSSELCPYFRQNLKGLMGSSHPTPSFCRWENQGPQWRSGLLQNIATYLAEAGLDPGHLTPGLRLFPTLNCSDIDGHGDGCYSRVPWAWGATLPIGPLLAVASRCWVSIYHLPTTILKVGEAASKLSSSMSFESVVTSFFFFFPLYLFFFRGVLIEILFIQENGDSVISLVGTPNLNSFAC